MPDKTPPYQFKCQTCGIVITVTEATKRIPYIVSVSCLDPDCMGFLIPVDAGQVDVGKTQPPDSK